MQAIVSQAAPAAQRRGRRHRLGIGCYTRHLPCDQQIFSLGAAPARVARFAHDVAIETLAQHGEECASHLYVERQAWWKLHQQRAKLGAQRSNLAKETFKWLGYAGEAARVRN